MPARCASVSDVEGLEGAGDRAEGVREVGGERGVTRGRVGPEFDLDHVADACGPRRRVLRR